MVACDSEVSARPGADVFDRPLRDGHLFFASFPSPAAAGYRATFTKSLPPPLKLRRTSRDESSAHTAKPYVDANGQPPDRRRRVLA